MLNFVLYRILFFPLKTRFLLNKHQEFPGELALFIINYDLKHLLYV